MKSVISVTGLVIFNVVNMFTKCAISIAIDITIEQYFQ